MRCSCGCRLHSCAPACRAVSHWGMYLGAVGVGVRAHLPFVAVRSVRGTRRRSPRRDRRPRPPTVRAAAGVGPAVAAGPRASSSILARLQRSRGEAARARLESGAASAKGPPPASIQRAVFRHFVAGPRRAPSRASRPRGRPVVLLVLAAAWLAVRVADGGAGRPRTGTQEPHEPQATNPDIGRKPCTRQQSVLIATSGAIPRPATCPTAGPSPTSRSRPRNLEGQERREAGKDGWHPRGFFGKSGRLRGEY